MKGPLAPPPRVSLPPEGADPAWAGPTPDLRSPVTLADHERSAQERLDPGAWAYLFGGAADEITLRDNEAAWQRLRLRPRVLQPLAQGHTRLALLGRTLEHPILIAPMAYQRLAHPLGEQASALAAAMQGAGYVLSTQASVPMEDIASLVLNEPTRGPLWFQLYWQADRGWTRELIRRAEASGFEALVLTVDAPVQGVRDRERRARFRLPAGVGAINLPLHARETAAHASLFDSLLSFCPDWDELNWLRSETRLPILLKGISHPDDARLGIDHGASGLIVSNHGGRTLDTMPATASLLPEVVAAVAGRVPVLVDGGIRRGTDVFKAIALGASAVLAGRPVLHGLASGGAMGVAHVLRLLRDELEIAMALCGCRTLQHISPRHLLA
jgi:4-hydroxymandelate oxidase